MQLGVNLPSVSIEQIVGEIISTRRITRADQDRLMSVLLSKQSLNEAEQVSISRVFDGLRAGLIKVID